MRNRAGFTLVELMVALTLATGVLVAARRLFEGIADALPRLAAERVRRDHDANARRMLTELVGSLDVTSPGAEPFDGAADRARFTSWTVRRTGWPELVRVDLRREGHALVVSTGGRRLALLDGVDRLDVDYLLNPGAGEEWVARWVSPSRPPVALRLRVTRSQRADTLLLLIGRRG